ncbi:MAG: transporter substrate-binding domain-containing protein, partial [Flavobacteriales bacterium]|nr:transporter substrate-binding domain-containing protein [Flavobacteriales bacterium]
MEKHPVINFGYEPKWLPFEIYENGEYSGIIGDYVKILERETGIDFNPIPDINWDETVLGLKSGEIDFTCCAGITEERKEYLNFTKPYVSSPMVIVTRKDGDFVGGLEDLAGKKIALPKNYYTGEIISRDYPKITIDFKESVEASIRAVSLGEAEAFVGNLVVVSYYIEHIGYTNLKIAAPTEYEKTHIALAARKDWPELITICQKVFDNIKYEERDAILQKWMKVRYEFGVDTKKVKKYTVIIGLIILIIFIIILQWNKSLKKEIAKRKVIEKKLKVKNKDVTDSITYAKRIQDAILPSNERFTRELSQTFILFKPKDIVSGDFYWLVTKGDKSWFAAVDCTGHGVPGAFMSIVGYNLLNKIVGEYGITEPSKILDELNKGVANMLKKDDDSAENVRDGMDIALCCFDKKSKVLEYAGAYNPLYIVSKHSLKSGDKKELNPVYTSEKGLNLYDVKANRFSIGNHVEETLSFTNHRIQLNSGDIVYLFSDGYVDQFGGEKGKKYRYKRFKEYLVSINDLSMEEQKLKLEAEFINWMGPHEQIDDVIVIG